MYMRQHASPSANERQRGPAIATVPAVPTETNGEVPDLLACRAPRVAMVYTPNKRMNEHIR
jgi:hypothetical protein